MKDFKKAHEESLEGINVSGIPSKYRVFNPRRINQFSRFFGTMLQNNKHKGIDFGCGVGTSSIIAKCMGLHVTGIDIPNSIYLPVHKNLINMGYNIVLKNTQEFPWTEFEDDQFDFMIAMWSIGRGAGDEEQQKLRIKELARITKPGSIWIVDPKRHVLGLVKRPTFIKLAEEKEYKILYRGQVKTVAEMNQ